MKINASDRAFITKITALWTVFLLGTLFHTQLALMPLFHGLSVTQSHTDEALALGTVMWLMLIFFSLPLIAVVVLSFSPTPLIRQLHYFMTLLYSVLNAMHLIMDAVVRVPSYQLALMFLLLCIGLLLNITSYRWVRAGKTRLHLVKS